MVKALLDLRADIKSMDPNGETALFRAAEGDDGRVVALLLKRGAERSVGASLEIWHRIWRRIWRGMCSGNVVAILGVWKRLNIWAHGESPVRRTRHDI